MCHFLYICFYIISDLYNHLSAMFLFFIISVYLSSVYIVSFYKFVFYILSRHPHNDILICHLGWSLRFLCRQEKCHNDGTKQRFGMLNFDC